MTTAVFLPLVRGVITSEGTAHVVGPDGVTANVGTTDEAGQLVPLDEARRRVIEAIADYARVGGHERVHASLTDPQSGTMDLAVTAAGGIEALPEGQGAPAIADPGERRVQLHEVPQPAPVHAVPSSRADARRQSAPPVVAPPLTVPPPLGTFLAPEQHAEPAASGWRGTANRLGLHLAPAESEVSLRRAVRSISRHWPGVRTIAVVNAKGSANKTPTTIGLAAAFARYGGGGVAAVDNNPTRGTLPWRTEQGPHSASVTDLLPHIDRLMAAGSSGSEMTAFLHHQTEDRYDVLRSKPERLGPPFTADEFDQVVRVLSKYYRLLVFDSGNDETAPVWQHMIGVTRQLVVPTLARREWAEAGRLLLEELAATSPHGAMLARNAVVIVSQADERRGLAPAQEIADRFTGLVRAAAVIPYDPHMVEGHMRWDGLARPTRDAWVRAAALVAEGF